MAIKTDGERIKAGLYDKTWLNFYVKPFTSLKFKEIRPFLHVIFTKRTKKYIQNVGKITLSAKSLKHG